MNTKIIKIGGLLLAVAVLSSACSITTQESQQRATKGGSVFISSNYGDTWKPVTAVRGISPRVQSIADFNIHSLSSDPNDHSAVYLATFNHGLYYTYNITEGWDEVKGLPKENINDVQVDPQNKCTIYTAIANKLYRSVDCSRSWKVIYFGDNKQTELKTIVVDHYNHNVLYLGTSRGEIIKSIDGGQSWRTIKRLNNGIAKLIMSPVDSRFLIGASVNNDVFSFISITNTNNTLENMDRNFMISDWMNLSDVIADYQIGNKFSDLVISPKDATILLATRKAILRSKDNGISWEKLNLIASQNDININAIAIGPHNSNNLYYVTNTTFYRSKDAGLTWTTKKLPGDRNGHAIMIDSVNPNVIYLGTIKLKK